MVSSIGVVQYPWDHFSYKSTINYIGVYNAKFFKTNNESKIKRWIEQRFNNQDLDNEVYVLDAISNGIFYGLCGNFCSNKNINVKKDDFIDDAFKKIKKELDNDSTKPLATLPNP